MKTIQSPVRRIMPAFFSLFTFLFCFVLSGFATIFYISPTGNDVTGNGTSANPWKTLYKATATVSGAGDIIHVNAGTYIETQQSFLKVGVSIEGEGITSIIKSTLNVNQVEIINARSGSEGTRGNQHISNLKFDGQNTTSWAITIFARSNVSVYNCTFVDFDDSGVLFAGRVGFDGNEPGIYATGNSFYNNIVNNCAKYSGGFGRGQLWAIGQEGMLIHDNVMTQNQRPLGQNGWFIKALNFSRGMKIYNNTLTKIPFHGTYGGDGGWDFAIEMADEQGVEIYGNTIQGAIDLNRQTKGAYAYSAWIHDNVISQPILNDNYESGIIFEYGTETAIIENNILNNVSGGLLFNTRVGDAVTNITIRNNLLSNIGRFGIDGNNGAFIIISSEGTPLNNYYVNNFNVFNNTMVSALGSRINYGIEMGNLAIGYEKNINIKNNIMMNVANAWITSNSSIPMDSLDIRYNDIYNNGNGNNSLYANAQPTHYTLGNNLNLLPIFVSTSDYHLKTISPLIDAGVYVGLPYFGTAPDRGYAEVTSALPVKLTAIKVTENKGNNLLQWTTSTESNSSHFNIERSSNGQDYEVIGNVAASGFSSNEINYYFTDAAPLAGINYYRLAMIDKDNSKEYSSTVSILSKTNQSLNIVAAQLATAKKDITIKIASTQNQKANLIIFDQGGRIILNEAVNIQKGMNTINKTTPTISKGIYYLKLFTTDATVVKNIFTAE